MSQRRQGRFKTVTHVRVMFNKNTFYIDINISRCTAAGFLDYSCIKIMLNAGLNIRLLRNVYL